MVLTPSDAKDFLRLLFGLMHFVHRSSLPPRKRGRPPKPYAEQPLEKRAEIHQLFGKDPAAHVAAYIAENPERLSDAEIAEIAQWKDASAGRFIFLHQLEKHLVAIEMAGGRRVFAVRGLRDAPSTIASGPLPQLVETVLLPFRGVIVCDGLVASFRHNFPQPELHELDHKYQQAKAAGTIITDYSLLKTVAAETTGETTGETTAESSEKAPEKAPEKAAVRKRAAKKRATRASNPLGAFVKRLRKRFLEYRSEYAELRRFEEEVVPFFQTWVETKFKKQRDEIRRLEEDVEDMETALANLFLDALPEGFDSREDFIAETVKKATEPREPDDEAASDEPPPTPEMPSEEDLQFIFDEFLIAARNIDPDEMDPDDYARAFAEFVASVEHVRDGNRAAFERSMLAIGADRSKENVDLVNKAYRRLAKRLHPDKNPDHGEEAKEFWERLRNAKEALDLRSIEKVELEWRLLSGDEFETLEEDRLKSYQEELRTGFSDLRKLKRELSSHPLWGYGPKPPPREVVESIREEIEDELADLRDLRDELVAALESRQRVEARRRSAPGPVDFPFGPPNAWPRSTAPKPRKKRTESPDQMEFPF